MTARTIRTFRQRIVASPDAVFPLLCPVREAEWLDGWADQYELLHSESGVAEKGCVFRTFGTGEPETIWVISEHDRERGVVEFVRVTPGLAATTLQIQVGDNGDTTSSVEITYTVTPTSQAGAAFAADRFEEARFRRSMAWWESSMNHFLQTGTMLRGHGH